LGRKRPAEIGNTINREKEKHGKEAKYGKSGIGSMSSLEAQKRYQYLKKRMQAIKKDQCIRSKVNAVFKDEIKRYWENDDDPSPGKSSCVNEEQLNQETESDKEMIEDLLEEMGFDWNTIAML
jgi:hypothetical protein